LNGSPLPYFNRPIMLPAVASYFLGPASAGASAVKTWPHRWQRSFCNWYTVAASGGCPVIRTSTPGAFS
jgi:hypothetical protein